MSELSIHELETQHGELLPEREALSVVSSADTIVAAVTQSATAVQAVTEFSSNVAANATSISIS
jgi:hypothetical protein